MKKIVIATIKSWNIKNVKRMELDGYEIVLIQNKSELTYDNIRRINPRYIFVIHWSWYIPEQVFQNYECIVFHPTRLPFGRGGSPIQNLIIRGYDSTAISAVRVGKELDAGDLYPITRELCLYGTAEEILIRMSEKVCFEMIPWIVENQPEAKKQEGNPVVFVRRKPSEGELNSDYSIEKIYDMIRMLDGEGYPKAFIQYGKYKMEFSRASLNSDGIIADVKIYEEDKDE